MIKLTVLYSYDKTVAKLSKVYEVSKQTIKDHFDDMNVELSYQTRKAFGRDYLHYMIKQSDIEECRHWLATHKDELAKVEKPRTNSGYVLDNHKDEPLHFNTQREVADFLGYKATGFTIGKVYRGYELKRGSVPENNSITNSVDTEVTKPEPENQPLDTDSDIEVANSNTEMANNDIEVANSTSIEMANNDIEMAKPEPENQPLDTTSTGTEMAMADFEAKVKSDFEAKIDAYFSKYYDLD